MRRFLLPWLLCGLISACHGRTTGAPDADAPARLQIVDLRVGTGAAVHAGETAVVDYTGWLYDPAAPEHEGRQFDSSLSAAAPLRFELGAGRVIKGWDEGVAGMRIGGRRRLVIPAALAYGERGAGGVIPPGAALVFEIDLIGIQ